MRVQVRNCPYMSMSEREEVLSDHQRRALAGEVKHQILMSTLAAVKKAGRRAAAVHSMDKQQHRRALSNHAVNFFWNYNTVRLMPSCSNSPPPPHLYSDWVVGVVVGILIVGYTPHTHE
jgi:hypothetical protein